MKRPFRVINQRGGLFLMFYLRYNEAGTDEFIARI